MGTHFGDSSWWGSFLTEWKPTADFLSSVSSVLLLGGVVVAFLTYRSATKSTRLRNTLDKISSYRHDAEHFQRAIQISRQHSLSDEEAFEALSQDEQRLVIYLINEWDELALYIRHGVLDEKLLFQNYGAIALEVWSHTRGVIRFYQGDDPNNWKAFDWLAIRWMVKRDSRDKAARTAELRELQRMLDDLL